MTKVTGFTLHNYRGQSVPANLLLDWKDDVNHPSGIFGPIKGYSWFFDDVERESVHTGYWRVLPDSTGFICFESASKPDNCLLLDAYGHERMRLSVPWQMTGAGNAEGATFGNIDGPYANPKTGLMSEFGISGWVGQAKFFFALNYHTGEFLWCKQIRD